VRRYPSVVFVSFVLLFLQPGVGQQTTQQTTPPSPAASSQPQRDPQAITFLAQSLAAMASTTPSDSSATGTVTVVEGSTTQSGTIQVLTRGTDQSSEQITLPQLSYTLTYSQGLADETINSATSSIPLERAVTSQSVCFPFPLLAAALANLDESIRYVGLETLGLQSLQHIHIQNTFASQPNLQQLAELATFDVWLDASTSLPQRISFVRRNGSGASPRIPIDAYFSSFKTTSGVTYPTKINLSLNGTLWAAITIDSILFNTGLTDSNFPVH